MKWNELTEVEQLSALVEQSKQAPVLIFKHSTRCAISSTSLNRLERNWKPEEVGTLKAYYLDLLSHKQLSNIIAESFNVEHQSPQAILIENGKAIYSSSHLAISFDAIKEALTNTAKN